MRGILFRGKRMETGEWVYGYFARYGPATGDDFHIIIPRYASALYGIRVDPATVSQSTGMTDKNGAEIFEGDILKFQDEAWESSETSCGTEYDSYPVENYAVVGFHGDTQAPDFVQYKFRESQVEADLHENHMEDFYDFVGRLEIAGNTYDNPEMMDGGDSGNG